MEFSDDEPSVAEVAEHSAWTDRSEVHSPVLSTVIIRYWPFFYQWIARPRDNFCKTPIQIIFARRVYEAVLLFLYGVLESQVYQ